MCREYESKLNFTDYLTLGSHGRTGVYMKTTDTDVAEERLRCGWICEYINGGLWLRAPDISLVDITEPTRVNQLGGPLETYSAFTFLKNLRENYGLHDFIQGVIYSDRDKYANFDFYVSEGEVLEGEIRIGGSDSRVKDLKKDVLQRTISMTEWGRFVQNSLATIGTPRKITVHEKSLGDFDESSRTFISQIRDIQKLFYPRSEALSMNMLSGITQQLPEYDVMALIPTGCFRYIISFVNRESIDKIMLWEVHYDRNRPDTMKLFNKKIENRKCLIIDKTYTGNTINRTADFVADEGGMPIRFGLFPKSRLAVSKAEYILFLDQVIDVRGADNLDKSWIEDTFKSVISVHQEEHV